mmetsp:Transcript_39543/g.77835  ORF Transcript_39543/g.77835 Transcript_39543/m.77835 type:complete len:102 (-) Transcript_39543:410-715(-)
MWKLMKRAMEVKSGVSPPSPLLQQHLSLSFSLSLFLQIIDQSGSPVGRYRQNQNRERKGRAAGHTRTERHPHGRTRQEAERDADYRHAGMDTRARGGHCLG